MLMRIFSANSLPQRRFHLVWAVRNRYFASEVPSFSAQMQRHLARYFLPPWIAEELGSEIYWRALLCVVALGLTAVLTFPSIFLYAFFLHSPLLMGMTTTMFVAAVIQLAILRFIGSVRLSAWIYVVWQNVMMLAVSFAMGGISSIATIGLFSPPLIALILLGTKEMWLMLGFVVVSIVGLTIISLFGIKAPPPYSLSVAPIIDGFVSLTVIFSILAAFYYFDRVRKRAYQDLQAERDSVQVRVHEATDNLEAQNTALQQALRDIEQANALKDEFLRNISHEIRTPLTSILGFSEILSDKLRSDPNNRPFLEHITQAATNLLGIFSNILHLSQIEAGNIVTEQSLVGTRYIVNHIRNIIAPQAQIKGLTFSIDQAPDMPENMMIDGTHAQQIIIFLAENAIKFTEHGDVHLTLSLERGVEQMLVCEVRDTGIGIAPQYLDYIFTPFYQQDGSKNRSVGGLGLGLAIAKRLLEALDGNITVTSAVGTGSTFTVKIPCMPASA